MDVKTKTIVRVEIEFNTGTFGPGSTMQEITTQASAEGMRIATEMLAGAKAPGGGRVVGKPRVQTVTTLPDDGILGVFKCAD
jgi:hypothetical protein